jgi:hypothetical protein
MGTENSLFTIAYRLALESTPPFYSIPLELKHPGCEADHSPPSNAKVKKPWRFTSIPSYIFMARWSSNKARVYFTFT